VTPTPTPTPVSQEPSSDLLLLAQEAADAAAQLLLAERPSVLAEGASATKTSKTDPVTRADFAAQRVIADMIAKARPGDALLGEEGLERPGDSGWQWIVDPLDGTVNYLYGRDEWAVSIAVRDRRGATVAAVVLAPALGRTYTAALGAGCRLNGRRVTVRPDVDLARSVIATGFSYDAATRAAQGRVLSHLLPSVADIRRSGSAALDLADVAGGRIDAFYENDLAPWDWAAGGLLATEAGATLKELPGPDGRSGVVAAVPSLAGTLGRFLDVAE
jgi:myo-inositol-1(or 4)-monophosphatase